MALCILNKCAKTVGENGRAENNPWKGVENQPHRHKDCHFLCKAAEQKLANTEVTRYKREKLEMRDGARGRGT